MLFYVFLLNTMGWLASDRINVMWLRGRPENEVTNRKCWVHTYCSRSSELGSSVVARELD